MAQNVFGPATPIRFQYWYSTWADIFQDISTGVCNETLADYVADPNGNNAPTCVAHLDCMLENTSETKKASMAAAAIFLGILPAMLSMLGPSMTQLTILSARRPVLSLILAFATAGYYVDRLFSVESPREILARSPGEDLIPRIRRSSWGFAVSIFEYALAIFSFLNMLHLAVRLGDRTVMSFQCDIWFLPLLWAYSLSAIFLVVAIPFQFSAVAKRVRSAADASTTLGGAGSGSEALDDSQWVPLQGRGAAHSAPGPGVPQARQNSAKQLVLRELTTGMSRHASVTVREMPEFEMWVTVLFSTATFIAAFHIILGTCWFSSILFLSPKDAIAIIMRFFASAVICRLIVMVELASMKAREIVEEEPETPAQQSYMGSRQGYTSAQPYPGT